MVGLAFALLTAKMTGDRCTDALQPATSGLGIDQAIGLTIVTVASIEILYLLGFRDPVSIVLIAVGCASHAAQRLLQVQRFGSAAARRGHVHAAIGVMSFAVISLVRAAHSPFALRQSTFPAVTWYAGVALAVAISVSQARYSVSNVAGVAPQPASRSRPLLLILGLLLIAASAGSGS